MKNTERIKKNIEDYEGDGKKISNGSTKSVAFFRE